MMLAVLNHEQELICQVVQQYVRRLGAWVGAPEFDREDVAQEWFVQLYSRLESFDPARGTLEAFLGAIMRNLFANWWRAWGTQKRRRLAQREAFDLTTRPASTPDDAERWAIQVDLAWFGRSLPTEQQQLLPWLIDERSYRAAARRMGIPFSTFMDRLQQLRKAAQAAHFDEYWAG